MFDARPPARPTTDILILITRFHLVKTWLKKNHPLDLPSLYILGNLPVERAKDAVCFLQWCGVSLASSAIIYNIVKVKVTR